MSKRFILGVALATAAAVLVAAGCGGGSSRNDAYANDKAAFVSAMESICKKVEAEQKAIGTPTGLDDAATKIPDIKESLDGGIEDLEDLQPPDEIEEPVNEFIDTGKEQSAKLDDLQKAAEDGNEEEFNSIAGELDELNKKSDAAAQEAGADGCVSSSA